MTTINDITAHSSFKFSANGLELNRKTPVCNQITKLLEAISLNFNWPCVFSVHGLSNLTIESVSSSDALCDNCFQYFQILFSNARSKEQRDSTWGLASATKKDYT